MKVFINERPSAVPAVLAQAAARIQNQAHTNEVALVCATAGFAGMGIDRGKYAMGGVSGVPPRGRPV